MIILHGVKRYEWRSRAVHVEGHARCRGRFRRQLDGRFRAETGVSLKLDHLRCERLHADLARGGERPLPSLQSPLEVFGEGQHDALNTRELCENRA